MAGNKLKEVTKNLAISSYLVENKCIVLSLPFLKANEHFNRFKRNERIDGRDPLVSHGSDMPVYGDLFSVVDMVPLKTEAGQPVLMAPSVADLVVYLQSLQNGT